MLRTLNDAQRSVLRHYRQGLYADCAEASQIHEYDLSQDRLLFFLVDALEHTSTDKPSDELDAYILANKALQHASV